MRQRNTVGDLTFDDSCRESLKSREINRREGGTGFERKIIRKDSKIQNGRR